MTPVPPSSVDDLAVSWNRFWFTPAAPVTLARVRVLAGILGMLLAWTWLDDVVVWFGPEGMVSREVIEVWRSERALSIFDAVTSPSLLRGLLLAGMGLFLLLAVGAATPVVAPLAALFHASLLHRGPLLAGPGDDVLAVILWCLVVGRSGDTLSVDAALAGTAGRPAAPSWRNRTALGLLRVHASVLAAAALVSQLKADVWWDGTAAGLLAVREGSRIDFAGAFAASTYLTNLVTHAITLFEIGFAAGVWPRRTRRVAAALGIVGWPLVGLLAGEPAWGAAMAILATACLDDAA